MCTLILFQYNNIIRLFGDRDLPSYSDPGASSSSGSMDGGVIAGIIFAVIAVLLAITLFICWKCYPHLLFQREKPFNSFIKVEVKPYAHYHAPQRVSRLDSTASENEEKRYSFKNNLCSEGGGGGADVTVCPIYASIQDNLNKKDSADGNLNNLSKCQKHNSEQKSPKKGMYQYIVSGTVSVLKLSCALQSKKTNVYPHLARLILQPLLVTMCETCKFLSCNQITGSGDLCKRWFDCVN